ncbi:sirohydrochlorin chelatase [Desulforamulus ruminis]|uniref:Cobalamin (Vitamin B12) biosynthesis CbiX protein n=1 Tax=Desulforamulus ruminis (strain ATCC 23193 / DSM 2154 / NCIMB 8452 / DL) TaxID=696281 RepID=F6DJW8_DESRL|nr:CbiX/SirB N-terminal domain-containing protein [Desulforamulus ruminis]AEG59182.1 cobalamin (vitamin B12) biosynthesis CbiX protein [Desulforamulus ruminis DSM 2154]
MEGVIILGHGSRRPEANQEIRDIAEQVKMRTGDVIYETCFLQFGQPALSEGIQRMVASGVEKITVIPLLLAVGNHIQVELPRLLRQQKELYPGLTLLLAPHLGADSRIVEIVMDRMKQGSEI